jgi:hypothetical protein
VVRALYIPRHASPSWRLRRVPRGPPVQTVAQGSGLAQPPTIGATCTALQAWSVLSRGQRALPSLARDIVKPGNESRTENVKFFAPEGSRLPHAKVPPPDLIWDRWPDMSELDIIGWLGFTDVDGNRWARSSEGALRRITKPSNIRRLTT